jgi:hypothetical protein
VRLIPGREVALVAATHQKVQVEVKESGTWWAGEQQGTKKNALDSTNRLQLARLRV